ncbi:MAG: 3-oxoacyl-ACP reductase FabG [Chloroflexaceae bacterium]|nr:3-oxoacyl-ACP reductase FabG [Chloroflexaceae bacterium]
MKDKAVLLTGGTGGLGLGVVSAVLARGAKVTLPYRGESGRQRLQEQLTPEMGDRLRFVPCDLSNEGAVAQLVAEMGRVEVLIHLVGGFSMGATHQLSYDDWQASFNLNLNTTFLVCKHCLGAMLQQDYGRIVTVGSGASLKPGANLAAYSAAKAGVAALTQAIAAETKGTNITANVVLPSVIDTPTNREAMGSDRAENWVKPESLAEAICFLASAAAGDLRGAVIPVFGNT